MKLHRAILAASVIAAVPALAHAQPTLRIDLRGGAPLHFVRVPAGSFTQGSPPTEPGREPDERPHEVLITESYYISTVPVTVGQFKIFTGETGYRTEAESGTSGGSGWDGKALVQKKEFHWKNPGFPQTDNHPVTLVTYADALAFTGWLTRTANRAFSLPTEAQWEHAYRAGKSGAYYQGTTEKDALDLGWFKANAGNGTRPVAAKKPNALGLYDMAGNVFEWCLDWYAPYPDGAQVDPRANIPDVSDKPRRVLRGGSWLKEPKHGRAAARYRNTPGSRNADNGFRVVAALNTAAQAAPAAPEPTPASTTPSPAPTPPAPPPAPATYTRGSSGGLVLLSLSVAAMALGAAFFTLRRAARKNDGVRFRNGPDGFWIHAPGTLRGATLHYRVRAATGPQEGHVVLEPSDVGQFVYTGAPPRSVEYVRLIRLQSAPVARTSQSSRSQPARQGGSRSSSNSSRSSPSIQHHHHHHHHHDEPTRTEPSRNEPEPFRGYPSAY